MRDEPCTDDVEEITDPQAWAEREARRPARWARSSGADWKAIELQVVRGRTQVDVAHEFGVSVNSLQDHKRKKQWRADLPKHVREAMSEDIIRTGRARAAFLGVPVDEKKLAQSAAWKRFDRAEPSWTPYSAARRDDDAPAQAADTQAEPAATTPENDKQMETTHDCRNCPYNDAAYHLARAERDRVFLELDRELRRIGFDPRKEGLGDIVPAVRDAG